MISKMENIDTFVSNMSELADTADWLKNIRQRGLDRFLELGIPNTKNEEWKYTSLVALTKKHFKLSHDSNLVEKDALKNYCSDDDINFVFVNGIFNSDLSNFNGLPEGIKLLPLNEAVHSRGDELQKAFTKYNPDSEGAFIALNQALTTCGAYIKVGSNTVSKKVIHIVHVIGSNQKDIVSAPRTVISMEKSSEITVLESHICFDNKTPYLSTPLTDVSLEENAVLHYCKVQAESLKAYHIGNTRVWQEKNSNFDGFTFMTGASINRNNLDIIVNGEGSNANLNGLYCVDDTQLVDNHSNVDHKVPNCTSNQLYKGLLNGAARAVFNGKIFVRSIAQQTNSYQLNKNLLLGKDCRVDTKPQLEIFADDVKCTHGATIGQLNEDELFYLQSRGIPKRDAVKMLAKGFVDDIFEHIPSESICQKLSRLIEPTFANI